MASSPSQIFSSPCAFNFSSTSFGVSHAHDENAALDDSLGSPAKMCDRRKKVCESVHEIGREENTHDLLVRLERSDWFPGN